MTNNQGFFTKLKQAIADNQSLLCLGLDPEVNKFSPDFKPDASQVERLTAWCQNLISQTSDLICCVKPNIAFFEQYGPEGLEALQAVLKSIPAHIPVLLDAKRGDIGSTASAYARAMFDVYQADAVTLSPYLGRDSIDPFINREGKAVFVLCQTSNPSAAEVQNSSQPPLYQHIAQIIQSWGSAEQIGLVVGATRPESLAEVRRIAPQTWILAPGVGAQGGDLQATLQAGLLADGGGLIIPVSRAVIYADDPRAAALRLRDEINAGRAAVSKVLKPTADLSLKKELVQALFSAGCIKFGQFTLASGKQSPIYVDLRRIISFPDVMRKAAAAYANSAAGLSFDRLAAVPYAALPATAALSLHLNVPMIYPRKEVKAYGTGQAIEGAFEAGLTAIMVEDVITTGGSILTAIKTLEDAGLKVKDVLVLVDRNQGGHQALANGGYSLHAALSIDEVVEILHESGGINHEMYQNVKSYLEENHVR
ncbi:MAG: orotidine-5'-phosphate decarboxylase [Anaerolineae bacterium]|nr:orotidine-5'-phosphate decarboxylase [Anaerolineae bacterium]